MVLTRRCFLIGSAAAIAATQIPGAIALPAQHAYKVRKILEVTAMPTPFEDGSHGPVELSLRRSDIDNEPIFYHAMSDSSIMRWVAARGHEIALLHGRDTLRIEMEGGSGLEQVTLIVEDDGVMFVEQHAFPADGPPTLVPMYPPEPEPARSSLWSSQTNQ